jgi:triosephosphate isomerase
MLRDFGAHWVLLGHSERRHDPLVGPESDELVAHKAGRATGVGLRVVACVGETAEERAAGKATRVIMRQLAAVAQEVSQWDHMAIAYEPVRRSA